MKQKDTVASIFQWMSLVIWRTNIDIDFSKIFRFALQKILLVTRVVFISECKQKVHFNP